MKARNKQGSMLALSAACTLLIAMVGVGFYFIVKIFGGARELQHATDAGNLDIARQALVARPTISPLLKPVTGVSDPSIVKNNFGPLMLEDKGNVSLKTYNRLAAQAFLVSANAARSDNRTSEAYNHAAELVQALQGSRQSVGGQLQQTLSSADALENPLFRNRVFKQTANSNSVRMLGGDESNASTITEDKRSYDVSYVNPEKAPFGDHYGVSNIEIPTGILLSGITVPDNLKVQGADRKTYLSGYSELALSISSTVPPVVAVSTQPGLQPHIISSQYFSGGKNRRRFERAFVPPNSFQSKASSLEYTSGLDAKALSTSIIGCLDQTYPLAMPYGYIEITNGSGNSVPGSYNNLDNILANELVTPPGILVSGNFFTTNQDLLNQWAVYNNKVAQGKPAGAMPPAPPSGDNAIFGLKTGKPATQAELVSLPHNGSSPIITAACTDTNTLSAAANSTCKNNAMTFQQAYYPGSTAFGTSTQQNPSNLMAVECMKCQLQRLYPAESATVVSLMCKESGLRLYNPVQLASSRFGACQVSKPGTIRELGNQVRTGFGNKMVELILEKANQIAPSNPALTRAQVTELLDQTTIDLGETKYLYLSNPRAVAGRGRPSFVLSSAPPSWYVSGTKPDGSNILHRSLNTYDAVNSGGAPSPDTPTSYAPFINTYHDGGIHDLPYEAGPDNLPAVKGIDTALFQPSSGYNNLLGVASFKNQAIGSGVNFNSPN